MRLALYGGSFDPPHVGHLMVMAQVLGTARVDRLMMVPCFRHPFSKALSPFDQRMDMARATAAIFDGHAEVSDIERRLGGDSRTLRTVKAIRDEHPGCRVVLVIGADLLAETERWYGYAELATLVEFFVVGRVGYGDRDATGRVLVPVPDVSSTEIRARVRRGESIEGLVPAAVADYVATAGLYRDAPAGEGSGA